ncbi:MAG: acyltransferase family protein [Actinomycetes bacterium]
MTAPTGPITLDAPPLRYEARLDGIRALSVAIVMYFHFVGAEHFPGGVISVEVFFGLSGFLITNLLLDEYHRDDGVSLRGFYQRRVLRLFPGMYSLLGAYFIAALIVGTQYPVIWAELGSAALYSYHLFLGFFGLPTADSPRIMLHLWTLSVEEWFYFFWPITLVVAVRTARRQRVLLVLCGVFIAFWMTVRLASPHFGVNWLNPERSAFGGADITYPAQVLFRFSIMRFDMLVMGCLLALIRRRYFHDPNPAAPTPNRALDVAGAVGAALFVCVLLLAGTVPFFAPFTSVGYQCAMVGVAAWILWVHRHPTGRVAWFFELPIMVWAGKRSYGLYLWHEVLNVLTPGVSGKVNVLLRTAFLFLASAGVAELSWRFVESPFLRKKDARFGRAGQRKTAST